MYSIVEVRLLEDEPGQVRTYLDITKVVRQE